MFLTGNFFYISCIINNSCGRYLKLSPEHIPIKINIAVVEIQRGRLLCKAPLLCLDVGEKGANKYFCS